MTEECRKHGPYYPVGDVDWTCSTHNALLQYDYSIGGPPSKTSMVCPVALNLPPWEGPDWIDWIAEK